MAFAEPYPARDPFARSEYARSEPDPAFDPDADFAAHVRTYRAFVRYTLLFAAHVAVILAAMAYFLV
jgi:hypothetical protein